MKDIFSKYVAGLNQYLRLQSPPVAVKILEGNNSIPMKSKQPKRDLGYPINTCQALAMARRFGWVITLGPDDQACPIGSIILGFKPTDPFYLEGNLAEGMYTCNKEAGRRAEAAVSRFEYAKYRQIVIGPLDKFLVEPDLVIIYGNPAQVMRLVHGGLYKNGGAITSSFSGRGECGESIVRTMTTGQSQVLLPGNGERVFGMAQDHEMAFSVPWSGMGALLNGLEATHKAGVRYPIPAWLTYQPKFPAKYEKLLELWDRDGS